MNDLLKGAGYLLEGTRLIRAPRIRRFVLVPLALNILVFGSLIFFAYEWFQSFMARILGALPGWLAWLEYLLWPLFAVSVLLVLFYGFTLIANLIAAPFNGLLAEAVEKHLADAEMEDGSWKKILKEIVPALLGELRKLLYFVVRAIPLALLFVIPVINIAAPVLWGLFSAWMLAIEYADYPMGNHGLFFPQQRQRLRTRRFLTLGFGGMAMLLTMIPVLNFVAMPAAVAGATAMWVREFRRTVESGE